jgi:anaphase-promoting complex subunit 8
MYLDGMDEYSNALYVHEDTSGLCQLARDAVLIDRYRPETCCIIGNYHSLCGDHVQAVLHFRRALRLNPRYGATWTLLGHELINLKQTRAAVSAYRSALAITPHDYRAWYGLAQVYEILSMPLYALYYFERAAELRPTDARMWTAMASCYESLSMWEGAARCYERAIVTVDREGTALPRVAKLYATRLGNQSKAAHYYVRLLSRLDREGSHGRDVVEALGFLANHEFHAGNKEACSAYCHRLLDYNCKERDDAQALLARMGEAV